jgi:transcription elongation GreA/GreB family factor
MSGDAKRYFFTPRGVERLRRRIAEARAAYLAVCEQNPEAREAGDSSVWHDNFAFEETQRQMHQLARRVRDLESVLLLAEVVTPERAPVRAAIGTRVHYRLDGQERASVATLVGWDDGDPASKRVSYNSPLGVALIGATVGEERELLAGGRPRTAEILAIEVAEDL